MSKNITIAASSVESLSWDPSNSAASLDKVRAYVESEALKAGQWYFTAKRWKARSSQAIRLTAVVATALAGLLPIATNLWPSLGVWLGSAAHTGLMSSLLVGLAAGLLGVDRAFGFSTGWIRYILTASAIRKALEEFRLDWALLTAQAGAQPSPAQIEELLRRAKEFRGAIEDYVIQETKDWATEFQNSLAQLEKDAKTQLEALKVQIDKDAKATQEAARPSALELTVTNAGATDDGFTVMLEGLAGQLAREQVVGSDTWSRLGLAPGQYRLALNARIKGRDVATSKIVTLPPAGLVAETLVLPEPAP